MGICCSKHNQVTDHHGDTVVKASAEALGTAAVTVSLAAGTGLLEVASHIPFVAPVAFLIGAIIIGCQEAEALRGDCKEFSLVVQEIEHVMLKADNLSAEKETVLHIQEVMEEGLAFVQTLKNTNVVMQVIGSRHNANELRSCRDRLVSFIQVMTFSTVVDLSAMQTMKFEEERKLDEVIKEMGGVEAVAADETKSASLLGAMKSTDALNALMHKQSHKHAQEHATKLDSLRRQSQFHNNKLDSLHTTLEEQRILSLENAKQAQVMARQNEILMQQVTQMTMMMQQVTTQMQVGDYMSRFPIRPDEARTQLTIEELQLEKLEKPIIKLEDYLEEFCILNKEKNVNAILVDLITADSQVVLANRFYHFRDKDLMGRRVNDEKTDMDVFSKKMSTCQYVVAEDRVCCFRSKDKPKELMMSNEWFEENIGAAASSDPLLASSLDMLQSPLANVIMKVFAGEITQEKGKEVAVRMGHSLTNYRIMEHMMFLMNDLKSGNNGAYVGVPWKVQGKTVGVCCCYLYLTEEQLDMESEHIAQQLGLSELAAKVTEAVEETVSAQRRRASLPRVFGPPMMGTSLVTPMPMQVMPQVEARKAISVQ